MFETIFSLFLGRFRGFRKISQHRNITALLCSATKLIKYSKSQAVRVRRNTFLRDFAYFVEINPVWQLSVLPDISFISISIGSYLVFLAIFREDFRL